MPERTGPGGTHALLPATDHDHEAATNVDAGCDHDVALSCEVNPGARGEGLSAEQNRRPP